MLGQLSEPDEQQLISAADVVLIEVGANDFEASAMSDPACSDPALPQCSGEALLRLQSNLTRAVEEVRGWSGRPPDAQIVLVGYWNVFLDGRVGQERGARYVANSAALTAAVNNVVKAVAIGQGELFADALTPIKGSGLVETTANLAPDGDHPSARGHQLLSGSVVDTLVRAGWLKLAGGPTP